MFNEWFYWPAAAGRCPDGLDALLNHLRESQASDTSALRLVF